MPVGGDLLKCISWYNAIITHVVDHWLNIRLQTLNLKRRVQDHPEETVKALIKVRWLATSYVTIHYQLYTVSGPPRSFSEGGGPRQAPS